jgi:putative PIN family toxin of toxin-antitoxin system
LKKVVLDTNIYVSGLLSRNGTPAQVLDAWKAKRYILIISPFIIQEICDTLQSPHIQKKYKIIEEDILALVRLFELDAFLVKGEANTAGVIPQDASDEQILACAVDGQADFTVSGDHHLINLENFQNIPIITPQRLLIELE